MELSYINFLLYFYYVRIDQFLIILDEFHFYMFERNLFICGFWDMFEIILYLFILFIYLILFIDLFLFIYLFIYLFICLFVLFILFIL